MAGIGSKSIPSTDAPGISTGTCETWASDGRAEVAISNALPINNPETACLKCMNFEKRGSCDPRDKGTSNQKN
jgi:hypothetical protein